MHKCHFSFLTNSSIKSCLYVVKGSVQDALNIWVSKTTNFLNEVTSPLVKNAQDKNPSKGNAYEFNDMEEFFMAEQTIDSQTPGGDLSLAAIVSIEQFSR